MSHLTYRQREKFLSSPFFISDLSVYYFETSIKKQGQIVKNHEYTQLPEKLFRPIFTSQVRNALSTNCVFTVHTLTEDVRCFNPDLTTMYRTELEGKVRNTVLYLEATGYACFLPDIDGKLAFCNFEYYKRIKNEQIKRTKNSL